jgi:predicted nucleic acid-binding protein
VTYLLDTNVVSEARRRGADGNVRAWLEAADPHSLYISVLTVGEIVRGIESLARRDAAAARSLSAWLDGLRRDFADRLLPVDTDVAEAWGTLSALRSLPVVDALLVATARIHGLTLVTRNVKDIAGLGVAVIDPWASPPHSET